MEFSFKNYRFFCLPAGLDLNGAAVSADATESRLAIAPKGEVISVLEGAVVGFSIRRGIKGHLGYWYRFNFTRQLRGGPLT